MTDADVESKIVGKPVYQVFDKLVTTCTLSYRDASGELAQVIGETVRRDTDGAGVPEHNPAIGKAVAYRRALKALRSKVAHPVQDKPDAAPESHIEAYDYRGQTRYRRVEV